MNLDLEGKALTARKAERAYRNYGFQPDGRILQAVLARPSAGADPALACTPIQKSQM